jgi:hypothetical protein
MSSLGGKDSPDASAGAAGSSGAGGTSGGGGSPGIGGGSDAQPEIADSDATPDDIPLQPYCEPNPPPLRPGCPADEPTPGSSCAAPHLECVYREPSGDGLTAISCVPMGQAYMWIASGWPCRLDCSSLGDAASPLDVMSPTACGDRPIVNCRQPNATNQMRLTWELTGLAIQCNIWQSGVMVYFEQGCATRVSPSDAPAAACIANAVANLRFDCATNLACGLAAVPEL